MYPDGQRLITGDARGLLQLWERDGRCAAPIPIHSSAITALAMDFKARWVSASAAGAAFLSRLNPTHILRHLEGHQGAVRSAAFNPDGTRIATSCRDGLLRLWHADSGTELLRLSLGPEGARGVAFSPDGQSIAALRDDGVIWLWEGGP